MRRDDSPRVVALYRQRDMRRSASCVCDAVHSLARNCPEQIIVRGLFFTRVAWHFARGMASSFPELVAGNFVFCEHDSREE